MPSTSDPSVFDPPVLDSTVFDPALSWELHPRVALRPEPFGALAYHYDNRKLNFLRSHDLVTVVNLLGAHRDVPSALTAAGIEPTRQASFTAALAKLAAADFLQHQGPQPKGKLENDQGELAES